MMDCSNQQNRLGGHRMHGAVYHSAFCLLVAVVCTDWTSYGFLFVHCSSCREHLGDLAFSSLLVHTEPGAEA